MTRSRLGYPYKGTRTEHGWRVLKAGRLPHVVPVDDLRPHDANASCWCRPTKDDGVWIHHSIDRREEYERGERRPT